MSAHPIGRLAGALTMILSAGCATQAPRSGIVAVPVATAVAAPVGPINSASHEDWRALLPAPFGSGLAQVQFPLKEVILFQGDGHPVGGSEDQECYSKGGAPFAFRGAEVEDYVVCFFHERLFRVEAALRLPKDTAAEAFPQWCDDWLSGLSDASRTAERCEGRDNETQFSATIAYDSELAGPLITVIVADIPVRDAYERRPQKTALPNQP